MIARIQIPKGWRRLKAGETANNGDRYLTWDLKEWIRADMLAGSVLRTADYGAIRRVKRKREAWVEVSFDQWNESPIDSGKNCWRYQYKDGPLMTPKQWVRADWMSIHHTRFWLRRGAR